MFISLCDYMLKSNPYPLVDFHIFSIIFFYNDIEL